ncbi:unnamed protein product [Cylicocyclus nassatus]|uniref:Macrophage migration inhibitory factor n=1 Tax=Cylicocyclus nassatus TaxID=53992 RepID=A0AA36GJW8_CYLNA|nr:unnamed protein product [Cylicocyclus nassatus]
MVCITLRPLLLVGRRFGLGFERAIHLSSSRKMPMVRVATNLPDKDVPANFEERLTDILADSMKKPKARIAVEVMAGQRITHGASRNPVVIIKIEAIGAMSPEDNIRHTQKVTELCQETLKLPKDKVVISFYDLKPTHVGNNGTTVAAATL